jgi:hypothetical protein
MKFRNPYDSILVLKAIIQEIMDQVGRAYNMDELNMPSLVDAQIALDELSYRVEFRGTPLYKLIAIVIANRSFTATPSLDFVLKPLSEDGRVYLRLLEMADAPGAKLAVEETKKVHVRRIVEI